MRTVYNVVLRVDEASCGVVDQMAQDGQGINQLLAAEEEANQIIRAAREGTLVVGEGRRPGEREGGGPPNEARARASPSNRDRRLGEVEAGRRTRGSEMSRD
jgi:hypothetical protein